MKSNLLTHLRLRWAGLTRTYNYSMDYIERTYRIYLNHSKVIHFRNGYPVYSLSTPAVFSKPAANLFARSVFSTIQQRPLPNLLSFAVNDACNVKCYHCSFYGGGVADPSRKEMTTKQCRQLIRDAQELGVSVINIVGGEPTLRQDLPEILRAVDKDLSTVTMFTNGLLLERQVAGLKRAGLDSVYVSIDSADPVEHDRKRGLPNLYRHALRGLAKAKSLGMSVGIATSLTPEDFRRGEFGRTVELARTVGAHEVVVFDIMPTGRMKDREDLVGNDWVEDLIRASRPYNDDPRYPGVLVFAYATSFRSTGCSCGTSYFYVSPYGDVNPCDFNHKVIGNVLERPLWRIWDDLSSSEDHRHAKWGGCKIKDPAYRAREANATASAEVNGTEHCENPILHAIERMRTAPRPSQVRVPEP